MSDKRRTGGLKSSEPSSDFMRDFMKGIDLDEPFKNMEMGTAIKLPDTKVFEESMRKTAAEMEEASKKMMQDAEVFRKRALEEIETQKSNMDFRTYEDSEGFQVHEGKSKDSGTIIMQKTKMVNGKMISKLEIIKDGKVFFKSSSEESTYSYRNENDELVTAQSSRIESSSTKKSSSRVTYSRTSNVRKRRKDHSTKWTIVIILLIIAAIVYFGFMR